MSLPYIDITHLPKEIQSAFSNALKQDPELAGLIPETLEGQANIDTKILSEALWMLGSWREDSIVSYENRATSMCEVALVHEDIYQILTEAGFNRVALKRLFSEATFLTRTKAALLLSLALFTGAAADKAAAETQLKFNGKTFYAITLKQLRQLKIPANLLSSGDSALFRLKLDKSIKGIPATPENIVKIIQQAPNEDDIVFVVPANRYAQITKVTGAFPDISREGKGLETIDALQAEFTGTQPSEVANRAN